MGLEDRYLLSAPGASPSASAVAAVQVSGAAAFVTNLYNSILLRSPLPSEVNFWVGVLRSGKSQAFVQNAFFNSSERAQLLASLNISLGGTNQQFVDSLYANLLGRAPDPAGEAFWINQLNQGVNRQFVIQGFLGSPEYVNLHQPTVVNSYTATNLVSDGAVPAAMTDPNLVNPWGIVARSKGPFWVNDNGMGVSTLYDGAGNIIPAVFTIPPPAGQSGPAAPSGIVGNTNTNEFLVNGPGTAAAFIFATEDGTISAWNSGSSAVLKVDNSNQPNANGSTGAVYKGLAIANNGGSDFLYATNFRSGHVDVFDSQFNPVKLSPGAFHDALIPASFAPFGIANINGNLYVTFAQQDSEKHDDVAGAGHGFVDVFSPSGTLLMRLGGGGLNPELNSPWAVVLAPADFGRFSNDVLVGSFGDSHVSAFNPTTGAFVGQLANPNGTPLVLVGGFAGSDTKGLWGLSFGNGNGAGATTTLFFTAGINHESDGVFGEVKAG
jgi:uncharacterized protein (TIGR03118 family)